MREKEKIKEVLMGNRVKKVVFQDYGSVSLQLENNEVVTFGLSRNALGEGVATMHVMYRSNIQGNSDIVELNAK